MRKRRNYPIAGLLIAVFSLLFGDISAATQTEPIQARAQHAYVTSMQEIDAAITYAGQVSIARGEAIACPVPEATFVDSWGAPRSGGRAHAGVDMMAPNGTPILAPAPGYVEHRSVSLGGLSFYLTMDNGTRFFGTHLSAYGAGGQVQAGDVIGYVGATGNAGSPHLHFEIHPDGSTPVNPYPMTATACASPTATPVATESVAPAAAESTRTAVTSARSISFCRYVNGGRINWRFIRCLHVAHGHQVNTPNHTRVDFIRQARRLRAYLTAVSRPDCSGPGDCPALIQRAFAHVGIGWRGPEAVRVASCESGHNPNAYNPSSGASGLFQQLARYWPGRAAQYGFAGASVMDPWANAVVSASMVRDTGGWSHWSCRP